MWALARPVQQNSQPKKLKYNGNTGIRPSYRAKVPQLGQPVKQIRKLGQPVGQLVANLAAFPFHGHVLTDASTNNLSTSALLLKELQNVQHRRAFQSVAEFAIAHTLVSHASRFHKC